MAKGGGSLLRLFRSECFDAHLHMYYLLHMEQPGIQDYLVNELYKVTDDDIDLHLLQLCQIAVVRYHVSSLWRFLLDKAAQSMHFALRIRWILQSLAEDQHQEMSELAAAMVTMCEVAVVNHAGPEQQHEFARGPLLDDQHEAAKMPRASSDPGPRLRLGLRSSIDGQVPLTSQQRRNSAPNPLQRRCRRSRSVDHLMPAQGKGDPSSCSSSRGRLPTRLSGMMASWDVALRHLATISHAAAGANRMRALGYPSMIPDAYIELGEPVATTQLSPDVSSDRLGSQFMRKRRRCDYFNTQNSFVSMINQLSAALVAFNDKSERDACLRSTIGLLNRWLLDRRVFMTFDRCDQLGLLGLHLPVQKSRDWHQQILHIHVDQCKVFSSATRAPFLLVYESANLDELVEQRAAIESLASCVSRELSVAGIAEDTSTLAEEVADFPERLLWNRIMGISPKQWRRMPSEVPKADTWKNRAETHQLHHRKGVSDRSAEAAIGASMEQTVACTSEEPEKTRVVDPATKRRRVARKTRLRIWGEPWKEREERIRRASLFGHYASWSLNAIMVKGGDDLRQEMLASQITEQLHTIFREAKLPLWLKATKVVVTSSQSGFIEFIRDSTSIHAMKERYPGRTLAEIFKVAFADRLFEARQNFIESCAAYSLLIWFLQVKDRHNGNLMMDSSGHVIHIDFGFMLSNSPGRNLAFEQSPFKLTQEFLDVMGGESSEQFEYFRLLLIRGFLEARKHMERITLPIRMILKGSKLPCFREGAEAVLQNLHDRFFVNLTEQACVEKVVELIDSSVNNWRTIQYDNFQRIVNGIL
mmetsp:Transcript_19413/g.51876  ORF Transcript_19413/g.51876 Transcript_19413/m.51876 type:complete len:814 (+) Transcript_19413:116-2557(+)